MNKKIAGGTILALLTAVGAGSYAISVDLSETNIDDHSTTIGDTINTNINDFREGLILDTVCLAEPIPEEYVTACANR